MKKILILLSSCMICLNVGTNFFADTFVSCQNSKDKKRQTIPEEDPGNFIYGSLQETNNFCKDDFKKYVDSSLLTIISLLNNKFLDQKVDQANFDFLTVLKSLLSKSGHGNVLIWNKQSVKDEKYCVDTFLDDWTFDELNQKDIDLIKSIFVSRKIASKKQKIQNRLKIFKDIKQKKDLIKNGIKHINSGTKFFSAIINSSQGETAINQKIKFVKNNFDKKVSPFFLKVKPRFEQIFSNFISPTNFNDIKDLTNVNGQNLISYIKKPENIKIMNENFNNKTDDDKALMLFMIKFNYMYKHISATDANPENGQFLFEALFQDVNLLWDSMSYKTLTDFQSSTIHKKLKENGQKIKDNLNSYFKDIYENSNSKKSLEPIYCLIEGIMYIIKQKFYKTNIDQPIKNAEIKIETIFQHVCDFVNIIKDTNNLKQDNIENIEEFTKDLLFNTSLLEGIFIENESINKTTILGSMGLTSIASCFLGAGIMASSFAGIIAAGFTWWYNKTPNTSAVPINDNLKNYCDTSWLKKIINFFKSDDSLIRMISSNIQNLMHNFLDEYRKNQDCETYIQTFDKFKDIIYDGNNNSDFLKKLQEFIDHDDFKNIITDFFNLFKKIGSIASVDDEIKSKEILDGIDNLIKLIGIDIQSENVIVNGSILKALIDWINNPDNSIDKTIDGIVNLLEQECNKWNDDNFEKQINQLTDTIKNKNDIKVEYVSFEEKKESNSSNPIINLNYKLKLVATNEVYSIEFKNKNFKKFPKNFKISKFEKVDN